MAAAKILFPHNPVLLVDDEEAWLNSLSLNLRKAGINNITSCSDSRHVMPLLKKQHFCSLILDLIMPHLQGADLLPQITSRYPDLPVIITTGLDQVDIAVQCMRQGAFDYKVKGDENQKLIEIVRRAIELGELRRENTLLKDHFLNGTIHNPDTFADIITQNQKMHALFQYMEAIAHTNEPVLITGDTGVGKELFARALHDLSQRSGAFVPVNIAGLDKDMLADNLFGHKKGAFTGAENTRQGLLSQAAGGTIFLDEIGDLDPNSQIKLLRLIQEREYFPLGSDVAKSTDARMIFATFHDRESLQNSKTFRADLFYRLRAHHIHIPPLKHRLDDLPLLLDHFLVQAAQTLKKQPPSYPKELLVLLENHPFPGNIRELQNMILDVVSTTPGRTIALKSFQPYIQEIPLLQESPPTKMDPNSPFSGYSMLPTIKETTNMLVEEALKRSQGNQSLAAEMLGVTRQALNWRLKKNERAAQDE